MLDELRKKVFTIAQDLDNVVLDLCQLENTDVTKLCQAASLLIVWHNESLDKE